MRTLSPKNSLPLILASLLGGCVSCLAAEGPRIPLAWYEGFDLYSFIADEKQAVGLDDLRRQLKSRWEDPFEVQSTDGKVKRLVSSCEEFFQAQREGLEPQVTVDRHPYNHIGLLCVAARVLVEGKDARQSYVDDVPFDGTIAQLLPCEVAYQINPARKIDVGKRWADVDKITSATMRGKELELQSRDAVHFVRRLGSGDFNGDGFKDLLLDITHAVKEGTHAQENLFVVTRVRKGDALQVVKRHSVLADQ